jgi:hypothetical protein
MNTIFRENSDQVRDDADFYKKRYDVVKRFFIRTGDIEKHLVDGEHKQCRFCGKRDGELNKSKIPTSFKQKAHVIPESLGNRSLLSNYECDTCNASFGKTIENDFGKWIKPIRTLSMIKGKKGIPTLTHGTNGSWRIFSRNGGLIMNLTEGKKPFTVDEENNIISFQFEKEPFRPVFILKCFYKIFLSLIPRIYLENFIKILSWVGYESSGLSIANSSVIHEFTPGPMPSGVLGVEILIRKENIQTPYAFLIIRMPNDAFQILIPDDSMIKSEISMPSYPINRSVNFDKFGRQILTVLDLSSDQIVSKEKFIRNFRFDRNARMARTDYRIQSPILFE